MTASSKNGQIKLLVFDMGHVIIDFEWNIVCDGFLKRAGWNNADELGPVLKHVGSLGYETGKIGTAGFLHELNRLLATDISEEEFTGLWNATFRENQEMMDLLVELKKTHPLYLLSNTNENHYNYVQSNFNVERHFDELFLSYLVGSAKPDLHIYEETIARSGFDAEHCLFVDDLEDNIAAARKAGMQAILFKGCEDLKEHLRRFEVL